MAQDPLQKIKEKVMLKKEEYKAKADDILNKNLGTNQDADKTEFTQKLKLFKDEKKANLVIKLQEKKTNILNKFGVKNPERPLAEISKEFKQDYDIKRKEKSIVTSYNMRYYAVFGCTFTALITTHKVGPTVAAFGLSTAFLCPELVTKHFK